MTRWEMIKDVIQGLYPDLTKEDFVDIFSETCDWCCICSLSEECNKLFYKHDENGNPILDSDGSMVPDYDFPGCDSILLNYFNEEVEDPRFTPKDVVDERKSNRIINWWNGLCPSCGKMVSSGNLGSDTNQTNFCSYCGQKLKFNKPE